MDPVFLILGTFVVAGVLALVLKQALPLPPLPPQVEIGGFAVILLVCLLTVFGVCSP